MAEAPGPAAAPGGPGGPPGTPAFEFDEVSRRHPGAAAPAVDRLSLALAPGELVCLLGPSGCGKTTALRVAAGLEDPDAGAVRIDGAEASRPGRSTPPERRGFGLVVQDLALFPHLTVGGNVGFGLRGRPRRERRERVEQALALVGLDGREGEWPTTLSGGEQQRVALARALAPAPARLLLDEPFSALDVGLRRVVRDESLHFLKVAGASALLVTHDPEEAMFMSDRIALMRRGRIVQVGTPEDLYFRPEGAFAAGFLGEVNRLPGVARADGGVDTPLGTLAGAAPPGARAGDRVQALVRAEGLLLSAGPGGAGGPGAGGAAAAAPEATVIAARSLGRTSLLHLGMEAGGRSFHLHARVAGPPPAGAGDRLRLAADPGRSFVFPEGD